MKGEIRIEDLSAGLYRLSVYIDGCLARVSSCLNRAELAEARAREFEDLCQSCSTVRADALPQVELVASSQC